MCELRRIVTYKKALLRDVTSSIRITSVDVAARPRLGQRCVYGYT